jgi:predicted patatin/cPLA2 family phospholipase
MSNGLVIEGGGMRGIFAAGVIDYLLDKDIIFDNVIGVSAGACHACSYVCGQRGRAFAAATDYLDRWEYCSMKSLRKTGNLFGAEFIYHTIPEELYPIDNAAFHRMGIKFQVAVTDCVSGATEYPQIQDMFTDIEWVRASASLPFLSEMVEINGKFYLDGGISDSIPLGQSIRQGNEKNLVILTRPRNYQKRSSKMIPAMKAKYRKYPGLIRDMELRHMMYNRTLKLIADEEARGRAVVIAPVKALDIGRTERDMKKLEMAYREGYYVAEAMGKKLEEYLHREE